MSSSLNEWMNAGLTECWIVPCHRRVDVGQRGDSKDSKPELLSVIPLGGGINQAVSSGKLIRLLDVLMMLALMMLQRGTEFIAFSKHGSHVTQLLD